MQQNFSSLALELLAHGYRNFSIHQMYCPQHGLLDWDRFQSSCAETRSIGVSWVRGFQHDQHASGSSPYFFACLVLSLLIRCS
jgi:hypothetical protein